MTWKAENVWPIQLPYYLVKHDTSLGSCLLWWRQFGVDYAGNHLFHLQDLISLSNLRIGAVLSWN